MKCSRIPWQNIKFIQECIRQKDKVCAKSRQLLVFQYMIKQYHEPIFKVYINFRISISSTLQKYAPLMFWPKLFVKHKTHYLWPTDTSCNVLFILFHSKLNLRPSCSTKRHIFVIDRDFLKFNFFQMKKFGASELSPKIATVCKCL